tara:strand:- start:296 stop:1816 length:1521 start_codon:yes stop_codon:yes gene_type:complete
VSIFKPSRNYVNGKVTIDGDLDVSGNIEGVRRYLLDDSGTGLGYGGVVGETLTLYVDSLSGSDKNDGLTAPTALKTIKKCLERIPAGMEAWDVNGFEQSTMINVSSGTYVCPTEIQSNNTIFVGATSSVETSTNIVQVSASNADGLIVDITFPSGDYSEDALRGQWIRWGTNSTPQLNHGWIYANEAGSANVTRCYVCHHNGAASLPAGQIDLINSDVRFEIPEDKRAGKGFANFHFSVELQFENITFDGAPAVTEGAQLFLNGNQKVFFRNCKFGSDIASKFQLMQVSPGFALLIDCYMQPLKYVRSGAQGYLNLRSSVFDGRHDAGSNTEVSLTFDGTFNLKNELIFRDVSKGFTSQGGVSTYDTTNTTTCLRFMEFNGVSTCDNGVQVNTSAGDLFGGSIDLPDLYGKVSSNYGVIASGGASVYMGSLSSLDSVLGTNFVSADGGVSNIAQTKFMTTISGGNVPFTGYAEYYLASTAADWSGTPPTSLQEALDRIAAKITPIP